MHNYHLVELYQGLRNGLEEANVISTAVAGFNVSPMDGVIRRLDASLRQYVKTQAIRSFYFDGPETATLMRRYRLATDLHALHPTQFPAPPVLNVPPLPYHPIPDGRLQELIALNGEQLPVTFALTMKAYEIVVTHGQVEHRSRCCLFGDTVEIPGDDVPIALTQAEAIAWLEEHATGPLILDPNYWSGSDARYDQFLRLVRGMRITLTEQGINQGLPTQLDKILVTGRKGELRGSYAETWTQIRYRLHREHPNLVGLWTPIVDTH